MTSRAFVLALVVVLAVAVAGCGGSSSSSSTSTSSSASKPGEPRNVAEAKTFVWCLEPGERLTPAFKREYAERYMTRASCHFWLTGELWKP